MKSISDVVTAWKRLWQHTELSSILLTSSSTASLADVADLSEAKQLERLLIRDLAAPASRKEVLSRLINDGEFEQAEAVLDREGFRASLDEATLTELEDQLAAQREEAFQLLQARKAELTSRGNRVRFQVQLPSELDDAVGRRKADADELLVPSQDALGKAEHEFTESIRTRLQVQLRHGDSDGLPRWSESIDRCLATREFRTAEFLLEQGAAHRIPENPKLTPRVDEWPYGGALHEVLDWYTDSVSSPIAFHEKWLPPDCDGQRLLKAIRRLLGDFDESAAIEFAETLERTVQPDAAHQPISVRTIPDGFAASVTCLRDIRLPCFAVHEFIDLRMRRVPLPKRGAMRADDQQFTLVFQVAASECVANLRWSFLLALASRPEDRRINLLRELGSQLTATELIPDSCLGQLELPQSVDDLRSWTRWLFDLAREFSIDELVCDSIVFYSGQRPSLVLRFVRQILAAAAVANLVSTPVLDGTWRDPDFRNAVMLDLLSPLKGNVHALAALSLTLQLIARPGLPFEGAELAEWLNMSTAQITAALSQLVEFQLLEQGQSDGQYLLPDSGPTFLLLESSIASEAFLNERIDELSIETPDIPSSPDQED